MSGERNSPCYIGRHPVCRHVRMAIVDDEHSDPKTVAKYLSSSIKGGLTIERTTSAAVRAEGFGECETCAPGRAAKRALAQAKKASQQTGMGL